MRILFVIAIDRSQNGPSVHLLADMIEAVKRRGHSVVTVEKRFSITEDRVEQIDERETHYLLACREPEKRSYAKRYLADLRYVRQCKVAVRKEKFDVAFLQSCTHAGFQMAWLKHVPTLFNVQDIFPLDAYYEGILSKKSPVYRVFAALQAYGYRKAAKVVTISEDMKATLRELGVPEQKLAVVHNWQYQTEPNGDDRETVCKAFYQNGKFNVVYAGNIGMAQSVETLVRAAAYLRQDPQIAVTIIGGGAKRKACEAIAEELKLDNLRFADMLPQRYSRYLYENGDVNIVTLTKGISRTSLPSKTAACYSAGRPVIYCVEQDCRTVQTMMRANPLIYRCDPDDPQALAKTILKIKAEAPKAQNVPNYRDVLMPQSPEDYAMLLEQCARRDVP
ncbi:MAG: glycosyltransferase family 4 protein [Oscillospiraceae bacterium]|nr:glycosyltransferase family 4 protein [Oscillospiraceae bacterium]